MYVASENGITIQSKPDDYQVQQGEISFGYDLPTSEQLAEAFSDYTSSSNVLEIKQQINSLESQQTDRRVREALAGTDNGWLANLNAQISTLRQQLT